MPPYDDGMDPLITSSGNPLIKRFKKLHRTRGRRETHQTIIEGRTVLALALTAGVGPVSVVALEDDTATIDEAREHGFPIALVSEDVLRSAADTQHPQSPVAMIDIPATPLLRRRDTLVLCDISDPGNVGTMIRSAAAFGWDVCVSGSTADVWSPKVLRAGVGCHFGVHISHSDDPIADVASLGLESVAAVVSDGGDPLRGERSVALLIGSESRGLSDEQTARADRTVTISTPGQVESLNAAVAASLLMYSFLPS